VSTLEFVASVISSLVWPAVVVTFVLVFRKQLKTVLQKLADRVKKISGGGFEAEFADVKAGLETDAMLTVPDGARETRRIDFGRGRIDFGTRPIESYAEGGSGPLRIRDRDRDAEPESGPPPYVQLDPKVRSLLITAKSIVQSQPREAVLNAGRALEWSITTTLDSLRIPYGVDAKGPRTWVPAIFALRDAEVVDDIQAASLEQLYKLFQSATKDSDEEVTALSALQYIMLVEKEVGMLAVLRDARLKPGPRLKSREDEDEHEEPSR
jgi:hypothetical protein